MMNATGVLLTAPEADMFIIPILFAPTPLPPAPMPVSIMRPFTIPDHIFMAALNVKVPLTIASVYVILAKLLNNYNKSRAMKPWSISKTRFFFTFMLLHNIFLAIYSAWTFWAMVGVMRRSIASPTGPGGLAATIDSFCRMHGPVGLGKSIYFNDTTASWYSASPASAARLVSSNGVFRDFEMGRLWNEGLAYYGWIFYLSKFYEVFDTLIILAKGKPSSALQTYHHAGVMIGMWAGFRYMAPGIWILCFFNSFIHALMYTYFTLSALNVKVPRMMKQVLTSLQITQFVVGASLTMVHSFVSFIIPTTVNGTMTEDEVVSISPANPIQPCLPTHSQTFATWVFVSYLFPLTYLFVSFFISSYVKRSSAAKKLNGGLSQRVSSLAEKASREATRNVDKEVFGGDGRTPVTKSPRRQSIVRRAI